VEEMNVHMNLHYILIKSKLTKSFDHIFHLIKKYACRVAGVCWLKQEKIAALAGVSAKTVERAVQFLKVHEVVKIYHTKRSSGLNGSCYFVLQPFKGELPMDEEIIVSVEEENVGAVEGVQTFDTSNLSEGPLKDKLSLSSFKALKSSLKKEEEIIYNARVRNLRKSNNVTEEAYASFTTFLVNNRFSEEASMEITNRVLQTCKINHPGEVMKAYADSMRKLQKRLAYDQEIYSIVDYFISLVVGEMKPSFSRDKSRKKPYESTTDGKLVEWLDVFTGKMMGK
jgi:hypothetical protein